MGCHLCFTMDTLRPSKLNPIDRILWHIDPSRGTDSETSNKTTAVARQQPISNNGSTVGSGVLHVVRSETMFRQTQFSSVQFSSVQFSSVSECSAVEYSEVNSLVSSQSVRGLLQLEAGS
jgi:hypothetical protein